MNQVSKTHRRVLPRKKIDGGNLWHGRLETGQHFSSQTDWLVEFLLSFRTPAVITSLSPIKLTEQARGSSGDAAKEVIHFGVNPKNWTPEGGSMDRGAGLIGG